jgi:hypothetical protein
MKTEFIAKKVIDEISIIMIRRGSNALHFMDPYRYPSLVTAFSVCAMKGPEMKMQLAILCLQQAFDFMAEKL